MTPKQNRDHQGADPNVREPAHARHNLLLPPPSSLLPRYRSIAPVDINYGSVYNRLATAIHEKVNSR